MRTIKQSTFLYMIAVAAIIFVIAVVTTPALTLIAILNGIFIGVGCGVAYCFRKIVYETITGHGHYDDVRLFALALICGGMGAAFGRLSSSITITADKAPTPWFWTAPFNALSIYLFILGGLGMIFAQGLDRGYIHGEDKRTVWAAMLTGVLIAALIIVVQVA